ncbi:CRAL-TRIO domain-containing protein [Mycena capillaripes]|nr:CRAL-TRIO domain-containing protein [Mycena capillaripes]
MSVPTHDEILQTFRRQLFDEEILHEGDTIGTDDETLLRFLRARKFNLVQAKTMIINAQNWRKTVNGAGLDKLYSEMDPFDYPERQAVFDCWPLYFHKTDKVGSTSCNGRPLNIHTFSGVDFPKLYKSCTPERHWQSVIVNAECLAREVLPACSRLAGRPIGTCLVVVDLKGFGLSKFWQMKNLARASFQISQDYFPETMGQLAIVNAPSSFAFIWSMIKPWLAKETAEKCDILGSDYKKVLLDMVDADSLPSTLGGNCKCEEGCHLSSVGPWLDGRVGWGPRSKVNSKVGDEKDATPLIAPDNATRDSEQHGSLNGGAPEENSTGADS